LYKQHTDLMKDLAKERIKDYTIMRYVLFSLIVLPFLAVILSRFNFILFGVVAVIIAGASWWYITSNINPTLKYLQNKYQ